MAAAVSKIMRLQDLVTVAAKIRVVTRFRNTIGSRRAAFDAPAAQSSHRRSQGHRRQHHRRPDLWQRRRGDRNQSGVRQSGERGDAAAAAGSRARVVSRFPRKPACWRMSPHNGGHAARRSGGPGVSIHRRHRSRQRIVRREHRDASGGARAGARIAAGHGRRQRDVLRNRAGQRAIGQRASRRGSADLRSSRLRSGAAISSRCW